eukprot:Gb_19843 [translate_table: standard]
MQPGFQRLAGHLISSSNGDSDESAKKESCEDCCTYCDWHIRIHGPRVVRKGVQRASGCLVLWHVHALEMVTLEIPYSECYNVAQIYKTFGCTASGGSISSRCASYLVGFGGDGHGSSKAASGMIAYKNIDDIPSSRELVIQVDQKNEAILVPIYGHYGIMSRGEFDLNPSSSNNDKNLSYDATGMIICAIGLCYNVARTYWVDVDKVQGKAYKVLLKAQEAAISALKSGIPVSATIKRLQKLFRGIPLSIRLT